MDLLARNTFVLTRFIPATLPVEGIVQTCTRTVPLLCDTSIFLRHVLEKGEVFIYPERLGAATEPRQSKGSKQGSHSSQLPLLPGRCSSPSREFLSGTSAFLKSARHKSSDFRGERSEISSAAAGAQGEPAPARLPAPVCQA